ncbi:hypothetical protein PCASD_01285 [Puccinia coronata f. sp. avenae]|uniref:Uncharacterized protein n=1 Tax=Puccinia coronata f. sp. avenae TaxID=200324 RepID=A0A2N5VJ02_9BASI|nr:hypothetical protein PCASD_01285 [Puccinia coronata f. sp. avenae]
MIPCEQQGCVNPSVQSIWPKKQNFQSAELHLLIEAICALTPSLQISNTGYSSPINCHSPRHDLHYHDSRTLLVPQIYIRRSQWKEYSLLHVTLSTLGSPHLLQAHPNAVAQRPSPFFCFKIQSTSEKRSNLLAETNSQKENLVTQDENE